MRWRDRPLEPEIMPEADGEIGIAHIPSNVAEARAMLTMSMLADGCMYAGYTNDELAALPGGAQIKMAIDDDGEVTMILTAYQARVVALAADFFAETFQQHRTHSRHGADKTSTFDRLCQTDLLSHRNPVLGGHSTEARLMQKSQLFFRQFPVRGELYSVRGRQHCARSDWI